jgi:PAS domain-containing protein
MISPVFAGKNEDAARADHYRKNSWISGSVFPPFRRGLPCGILAVAPSGKNFHDENPRELLTYTARSTSRTLDSIPSENGRKESEERLHSLISNIPQFMVFRDDASRWRVANRRTEELPGFSDASSWQGENRRRNRGQPSKNLGNRRTLHRNRRNG